MYCAHSCKSDCAMQIVIHRFSYALSISRSSRVSNIMEGSQQEKLNKFIIEYTGVIKKVKKDLKYKTKIYHTLLELLDTMVVARDKIKRIKPEDVEKIEKMNQEITAAREIMDKMQDIIHCYMDIVLNEHEYIVSDNLINKLKEIAEKSENFEELVLAFGEKAGFKVTKIDSSNGVIDVHLVQ